jgi:hypothetical protein
VGNTRMRRRSKGGRSGKHVLFGPRRKARGEKPRAQQAKHLYADLCKAMQQQSGRKRGSNPPLLHLFSTETVMRSQLFFWLCPSTGVQSAKEGAGNEVKCQGFPMNERPGIKGFSDRCPPTMNIDLHGIECYIPCVGLNRLQRFRNIRALPCRVEGLGGER